ncbi:MAG: response regulator transcription factor, partial [Caldilineaceae bacterium]|nr:response regulator transcription factor [Caldilineaceae bacterium]
MSAKILVVDDDRTLTELMSLILKKEGFAPIVAADGAQCIAMFVEHQPDLVVLDVTMPGLNGFDVCQRLRAMTATTPIIILTAQGNEEAVVRGLDLGADDYVVKPFQPRAFVARVRANLRRAEGGAEEVDYNDGYLSVDLAAHHVTVNQAAVKLTPTEFKLMAALVRNRGRVVTFRQLLEDVWGFAYIDEVDYLR